MAQIDASHGGRCLEANDRGFLNGIVATPDGSHYAFAADTLDGRTVQNLVFCEEGLSDSGDLTFVATLEDLDEASLKKILTEPKNALVKQYQRLFEMEDVRLDFAEDALGAIARRAIARKTGARGLRSILESILLESMFDLPSLDGVEAIVPNETLVTTTVLNHSYSSRSLRASSTNGPPDRHQEGTDGQHPRQ